jgi:hypothetical protein
LGSKILVWTSQATQPGKAGQPLKAMGYAGTSGLIKNKPNVKRMMAGE